MPVVKLKRIISVSSEDPNHKASNLLDNKKWRSEAVGESQVSIVIELSESSQINGIDIGNNGSAFVEVQVSRQANPDDFKVILPASSFLTPIESRNENNLGRVRMFSAEKLNNEIAKEKWDVLKMLCTQPFNKNLKYGLSFITVHSVDLTKNDPVVKLGAFKLKDEDDEDNFVGDFFKGKLSPVKNSVATDLRSNATLASLAFQSEQASKKRRQSPISNESSVKYE